MSNQLASLSSQFEELKCQNKAPFTQKELSVSQEQSMSAPFSQTRQEFSYGELSKDSKQPSRKDVGPGLLRVHQSLKIRS